MTKSSEFIATLCLALLYKSKVTTFNIVSVLVVLHAHRPQQFSPPYKNARSMLLKINSTFYNIELCHNYL